MNKISCEDCNKYIDDPDHFDEDGNCLFKIKPVKDMSFKELIDRLEAANVYYSPAL